MSNKIPFTSLAPLSRAVEQSPASIVITDRTGNIVYVNPRFEQITGYSSDEVIGKNPNLLKSGVTPAQTYAELWKAIADGGEWRGQLCNRKKNGELFWEYAAISGLREESGEVTHFVAVKEDITERKRLEEVHLRAQKLQSLGTLAGGIAHDFNNLLTAIRGNADLAAVDVGPDHAAAESLEEIRKACMRAAELVRRIMAFGRPREPEQELVDLNEVIEEVLKLLRSTLPAGIVLKTDFAETTPRVRADAGQIHEAIVNLTNNAVYAIGPRAGAIEYRLEPVHLEEVHAQRIPGLRRGYYARLTVTDDGCGMDAETLDRIFDAFYTTKPVGEGTGLGLSMVHGTMRSHGGAVTVESTPGQASTFSLYFPAVESNDVKPAMAPPVPVPPSVPRRVLYVDDEAALVFLANRLLSRLGHSVAGFSDPRQAVAAFCAHPEQFDVVVTDLSMPEMSGFELARQVLAVRRDMPILMTTGHMRAEDTATAQAIGIRALIIKPIVADELMRQFDLLLEPPS